MLLASLHPVLPHQRDDAGRRARLGEEGVFEELAGRGPLSRVSNQHPVQEAFEQRGDLGGSRKADVTECFGNTFSAILSFPAAVCVPSGFHTTPYRQDKDQ